MLVVVAVALVEAVVGRKMLPVNWSIINCLTDAPKDEQELEIDFDCEMTCSKVKACVLEQLGTQVRKEEQYQKICESVHLINNTVNILSDGNH